VIGIPAGIIRGVILPEPAAHYSVDDKAAWHSIHDGATCFGSANGMTPLEGGNLVRQSPARIAMERRRHNAVTVGRYVAA
jgi:hypothetical protein